MSILEHFKPDKAAEDTLKASRKLNQSKFKYLTRFPLLVLGALILLFGGGIAYTLQARSESVAERKEEQSQVKPQTASQSRTISSVLNGAPVAGAISQSSQDTVSGIDLSQPPETATQSTAANATPQPVNPYEEARLRAFEQQQQAELQAEEARRSTLQAAFTAPSTVYVSQSKPKEQTSQPLVGSVSEQVIQGNHYLPATRVPAISPYEVKAGTVIPSVMISGINSDLPGQIIAQVSENVYDTVSGRYLLIPQGARLIGTYDHAVVMNQKRVLIAWNRIIYPDASSLDLGVMPGADQSGYSGFTDKTNTHIWPTFRNAILLSAITAGVQLSQPQPQQGDFSYSGQQVVAGSLGMQMNQLGMYSLQRGMNYNPTLTIRPGYRFNVMVSKDIVLPPWQKNVASR